MKVAKKVEWEKEKSLEEKKKR
jgi:hypothetical protein